MDAVVTKLWGKRLVAELQHEARFCILFPNASTPAPIAMKPPTKRELLAQIIGEFMEYDGDPEGAADAVMEFYDKLNSDS